MLLKSLEIQGFKTFPDKTRLTFDKGITCVVGPNGSGKSNISDAVRWVLGEQSPKTLRCTKMEDVVFNGTDNRKKVGYAEVTLTIDNADRALPFDGDEVAVTRRYYRSGDSEYLINKAAVRLKDIHELFMDTGLGRDGYSMISQGKIDSIVSSKSEDRREIFEEASGISRYRYSKTEAERKLERTEENLLRLRDILEELEQRVGPLEKQAQKAKLYLEYAGEKRGLEIALWLDTLDKSGKALREQEDKIAVVRTQHEQAVSVLEDIARQTEEIYQATGELSSKADEVRRENADTEGKMSSLRSDISVEENNIQHNEATKQRLENDMELSQKRARELEENILQKKNELERCNTQLDEKQKLYEQASQSLAKLAEDDGKTSELMREQSDELAKLNSDFAEAKAARLAAESSVSETSIRLDTARRSLADKRGQLSTQREHLRQCEKRVSDTSDNVSSLENAVKGCELLLETRKKSRDELKARQDKLTLDLSEKQRHISFLENLERNLEGFSQSVRAVMKQAQGGALSGIHGPVSRVIRVPSEYAVAIETALGGAMQNIVTTNEENAKRAIAFLKHKDAGRATFLPMTTVKGRVLNEQGLDKCEGFVGIASDLCECEAQYTGILNSLLGRICIAENLDFAVSIASRYGYRFRVVTLDGQVVNAGGSLTGGSLNKKTGLLSRVSDIEREKKNAESIKQNAEKAKELFTQAQAECGDADAKLIQARTQLNDAREMSLRAQSDCRTASGQVKLTEEAIAALDKDVRECVEKGDTLAKELAAAKARLTDIERRTDEVKAEMEKISGSMQKQTAERESAAESLQNIRMDILSLQKDAQALAADIENAESMSGDNIKRREEILAQIKLADDDTVRIEQRITSLKGELERLQKTVEENNKRLDDITERRTKLEQRSANLLKTERDKSSEKENAARELARLEERKISLNKQYDDIISKLWDEYELTRRQAEEVAEKIENLTAAQKRLSELKAKIKALGTVNVAAIDEYREVSERYGFLKAQVGDVEKSRKEILALIGDLTAQMKEIFAQRFEQINKNFSETFKELFGGGNASLSLTDETDILNSGIDISCHPPGKIVSHLEALSGGERALVAIALYFAIMKVSPAPFCVMDEIEAALDDVNVDRFAQYLRRMNDKTQFILITHRRGTMEEADVLYGVTMQDEGISKLLRLHSSDAAASFTKLK